MRRPRRLYDLLQEDQRGDFRITKEVIPKGTSLRYYDPKRGQFYFRNVDRPLPIALLLERGRVWMSDTPMEVAAISLALKASRGRVLTSGLGLGLYPLMASRKEAVLRVDIVEGSPEVVAMVFPRIANSKMAVVQGDLYSFLASTDRRYDFVYLDVWPGILGPIAEADKAVGSARRALAPGGETRVWLQELIDRVKGLLPTEPTRQTGMLSLEPCLVCGKSPRTDYAGLCMDCSDELGVSELFLERGS